MNKNEVIITLQDDDQRLVFAIRKMRPTHLEQWFTRALSLMVPNPDDPEAEYLAAGKSLATGGIWKLLSCADTEAALALGNELLSCCSRMLDNMEVHCTPESVDGFVRNVTTLLTLKNEALKQNLAFLLDDGEADDRQRGRA